MALQPWFDAVALHHQADAHAGGLRLRLPDGDGLQAIALLRDRHGPVPVLVVTGETAPAEQAALAHPGVVLLHKPVQTALLLQGLLRSLPG